MARMTAVNLVNLALILLFYSIIVTADEILGCGGFVKSHVALDFSKIEIGLYTKEGSLKEKTECAPTNGYYFLPLYEKGDYILKVHPPAGWSFEPSQVNLAIDGTTDPCSIGQDINFAFNGFGITGRVITAGQKQGPSGINVQLVNEKGEVRNTVTTISGDFYFTPVIPGKYTLKASHSRWKLEPSQAVVQVTEGNTALPVGVLAVKGYDVGGSVTSFGAPLSGLHILLYSKENSQQLRVEGCKTALLQGVPDSPICYSITDNNGEFNFGLVPAGNYKLLALSTSPGQPTITYNVKPESVPFSVQHDSIFIKNAFEVHGFTVIGAVVKSVGGGGLPKARVLLDKQAVGSTDTNGKFTLPHLQPGTYTITFQHEQCEVEPVQLQVTTNGARAPVAAVARWRVCGVVAPSGARRINIKPERGAPLIVQVPSEAEGKWCTFLAPGLYSANVDLTEQEQRDGLQFYPISHKISVGNGPEDGISFSQLKGTVSGRVRCRREKDCVALPIRLRALSPDGAYIGTSRDTTAVDEEYKFPEVAAGSAEVSVGGTRLCWRERSHNVPVAGDVVQAPDFVHTGYVLRLRASHAIQVEYSGPEGITGTLSVPEGASEQCVPKAGTYTLTPKSCHKFSPPSAQASTLETEADTPATVYFMAVAHEVTVRALSPVAATDLTFLIGTEGHGAMPVGPLKPKPHPDGGFVYEHTMYMADGEVAVVSASSASLLFEPQQPQQVWGRGSCQAGALTFRARRALTLAGKLVPPVPQALITLTADGVKQTHITTEDGKYSFGPLDASKKYTVTAELESYVFSEPDENGVISARKLAEITVQLLDRADKSPLQGGLVSVSGGSYRRTAVTDAAGKLRFAALAPDSYYVKPNMKEYRFHPPHTIVPLPDGEARHLDLMGERVAWSCLGRVVSLGGAGWAGAAIAAVPKQGSPASCLPEEATTEPNGAFRIRGLLPDCVYTIQMKESNVPELMGLKLAKAPSTLEVKNNKDLENVVLIAVQPRQLTDGSVLIHASSSHYKHLRLTLATDKAPHTHLFAAKLDPPVGQDNPGVMLVLPRLPADNATYILQLESTLSKATHSYEDTVIYFESDGNYKSFDIEFKPKVKSSEQELRQTSFLVIPLLGLLALAYLYRDTLLDRMISLAAGLGTGAAAGGRGGARGPVRPDVLDAASIDHIVSAVNAAGKRTSKKKAQ